MAAAKQTPTKRPFTSTKLFKIGLPVLFIVVFAGLGTYMIRKSSAATGNLEQISVIQGHNCSTTGKYPVTIRYGSTGECVKAFQIGINNWTAFGSYISGGTYPNTQLATDGVFGNGTLAKVREFQTKKGLPVDGVVGQSTWDAFLRDCAVTKTCNFGTSK